MRYAAVAPLNFMLVLPPTGYYWFNANVAALQPQYARFFANRATAGDFVLMDVPTFEGSEAPSLDVLIALSNMVKPSVAVIPDVKDDMTGTLAIFEQAIGDRLQHKMGCPLMGVTQGKTIDELLECADVMASKVSFLGLPRTVYRDAGTTRASFVELLDRKRFFDLHPALRIHLLGADWNFSDPRALKKHPNVIGVDSAEPIWLGSAGIFIDDLTCEHGLRRPANYFGDRPISNSTKMVRNVVKVMEWLS